MLFTGQLWLGLCDDPTKWPWTSVAIIAARGMFVVDASGRRCGLDKLPRRPGPVRAYAFSS